VELLLQLFNIPSNFKQTVMQRSI